MTRRYVDGEKLFRLRLKKLCGIANCEPGPILRDATALTRAVREDCAKVAEETSYKENLRTAGFGCTIEKLAAAIRRKK